MNLRFYVDSPINLHNKINPFIPPVIVAGKLYVIKEKILSCILDKIGLLRDFIAFTRTNGYNKTQKWLQQKNLLTEPFLEMISNYSIDCENEKRFQNYIYFSKEQSNPFISSNDFKEIFKSGLIYRHILDNKEKFNHLAKHELNLLQQELNCYENSNLVFKRKSHLKKEIYKHLLQSFIENSLELSTKINKLNQLKLDLKCYAQITDMEVRKTGVLKGYSNSKFQFNNSANYECIKKGSVLNITFGKTSPSEYSYIEYLFQDVELLSKNKFEFDCEYVNKLFFKTLKNNEQAYTLVKKLYNNNNFSLNLSNSRKKSLVPAGIYSEHQELEEFYSSELSPNSSNNIGLQRMLTLNILENTRNSNMLIASEDELSKIICILNLEKSNLKNIHEIISAKSGIIQSEIVKFCYSHNNFIESGFGFSTIEF